MPSGKGDNKDGLSRLVSRVVQKNPNQVAQAFEQLIAQAARECALDFPSLTAATRAIRMRLIALITRDHGRVEEPDVQRRLVNTVVGELCAQRNRAKEPVPRETRTDLYTKWRLGMR
jgi:hypothetical protein